MRLAFILLLLANLLFFVWSAGYLGVQDEGREPQRLQNQLYPDKITVTPVSPSDAAPANPSGAAVPSVPGVTAVAPVAAVQTSQACRRIEGVAPKDGGVLQQSFQKAGFVVAVSPMDERSYVVGISGLTNNAAADKKAGELRGLGVTDFHVIQGEGAGFYISLGVFNDEVSAAQFLQSLAKKGVKSARVDARSKTAGMLRLELRGPAELFAQRLPQLLVAAPGAASVECP